MEMVKNEIVMNHIKILVTAGLLVLSASFAWSQDFSYKWKFYRMDASRTGVVTASADNVKEAMGEVRGKRYFAPDGRVFKKGSTPKVASIVIASQPEMAEVKEVIGWSPREMDVHAPECALSDWFVDALMENCEALTGKKVDAGFVNFGGIRVNMPKGEVLLDDILSMFPFRNKLCYLELKGKDIRNLLEQMAAGRWQVIGGIRCVADKEGHLLSAEIGGRPLDDDTLYGVTTIDFLLNGGDNFSIGKNAVNLQILDVYVYDIMIPYVKRLTAEGKPIEYSTDGRVKITD